MKIDLGRYVGSLTRGERVQILQEYTVAAQSGKLHNDTLLYKHTSKILQLAKQEEEQRQMLVIMLTFQIAKFYADLYVMQYQGKVPR